MLEDGIIQPSASLWPAQIVVTHDTHPHHRKRPCVAFSDHKCLYRLGCAPLLRIDNMVKPIADYSVFSILDLKAAYHQVEISPEDRIYITFEANGRLYEFKCIPMGVSNGVPKFQRAVDKVGEVEGFEGIFSYMDDVTVCGTNHKDHDKNVTRF